MCIDTRVLTDSYRAQDHRSLAHCEQSVLAPAKSAQFAECLAGRYHATVGACDNSPRCLYTPH